MMLRLTGSAKVSYSRKEVSLSFQTGTFTPLIPVTHTHTLVTGDILLPSPLLTELCREESGIKLKPPRTSGETECHCQDGPRPSHRNQHICTEKQDEILLD